MTGDVRRRFNGTTGLGGD